MAIEEEGFIEVPGGKVWYGIVGEKKNPPLIIIHGGPGYPHDSLLSLEKLAVDRQVVFYDQLGCGNSEKSIDTSLWTVDHFVTELQQIISFFSFEAFHLLGHSWGATIAAEYALKKSKNLKSVIFASPFLSSPLWLRDAKNLLAQLPENVRFVLEHRDYYFKRAPKEYELASAEYYRNFLCRIPFTKEMNDAYEKTNYEIYNSMWGPEEFIITGSLKEYDVTTQFDKINVPVLCTYGKFDEVSTDSVDTYLRLLPHAQKKMFEKSAHMAHIEEPIEYIKTIKNFLRDIDTIEITT